MTLRNVLAQKKLTVYQLSKKTGIPKTTLFNIFNGQSDIMECRVKHIAKIAETFSMSIEEILKLDPIPYNAFFESNLTGSLKESIELLKTKNKKSSLYYDCYWCQANSDINIDEVEGIISHEQAEYLRNKYLWGD